MDTFGAGSQFERRAHAAATSPQRRRLPVACYTLADMAAYALLNGKVVVFPDITRVEANPTGGVTLRAENDAIVGTLRLGEGDFITFGAEPQVRPVA